MFGSGIGVGFYTWYSDHRNPREQFWTKFNIESLTEKNRLKQLDNINNETTERTPWLEIQFENFVREQPRLGPALSASRMSVWSAPFSTIGGTLVGAFAGFKGWLGSHRLGFGTGLRSLYLAIWMGLISRFVVSNTFLFSVPSTDRDEAEKAFASFLRAKGGLSVHGNVPVSLNDAKQTSNSKSESDSAIPPSSNE